MLVNLFSAGKKFFRDFRFSFPRESSFPRRTCAKEDGGLEAGSAVKCRKAIFAYVTKRKSSSRILYACWNRVTNFFFTLKVWFYGNSVKLRQSPTHASSSNCIQRRNSRGFFYNLLMVPHIVSNMYTQVALAQSCANHSAKHLVLMGQSWDWLAQCQYTVTGWGRKFDLQLLLQRVST